MTLSGSQTDPSASTGSAARTALVWAYRSSNRLDGRSACLEQCTHMYSVLSSSLR